MTAGPRIEALYPLTPSQTGMWLQSAAGGGDRFLEQAAFGLDRSIDGAALRRALQRVVDRHGALRSSILAKGLQPVRAVLQEMRVSLRELAVDGDGDTALTTVMSDERVRGFTLNRPPLIRFVLLTAADQRAWLVVSFHHIVLDGWSLRILWAEAAALYAAELEGKPAHLPPVADERHVADWLRRHTDADSERYWRDRLAGFRAPVPVVDTIHSSAAPSSEEPAQLDYTMSLAAGAAIAAVAQTCLVTPAVVFEVLWALLLSGRSRVGDVAFAATVSGRPPGVPGIDRLVGCFINTVPIRIRFDDTETLRACVQRHHEQRIAQAEFEYCSAGQIHGWSEVPPGQALCQSLLVYQNLPAAGETSAASLAVEADRRVRGARTGYPITLLISPGARPQRAHDLPAGVGVGVDCRSVHGDPRAARRVP